MATHPFTSIILFGIYKLWIHEKEQEIVVRSMMYKIYIVNIKLNVSICTIESSIFKLWNISLLLAYKFLKYLEIVGL